MGAVTDGALGTGGSLRSVEHLGVEECPVLRQVADAGVHDARLGPLGPRLEGDRQGVRGALGQEEPG